MKRMGGRNIIKVINSPAAILTLIGVLQVAQAQSANRAQGEGPIVHLCCKLGSLRPNSPVGNFDCEFEKDNGGTEYFKFRWTTPPGLSPAGPIEFRLQYHNTTCEEYGRVLKVPIDQQLANGNTNNTSPIVTFLANSYLKHGSEFFHNNEYCLNKLTPTVLDIRLCTPKCSPVLGLLRDKKRKKRSSDLVPRQTACIRKCCDPGKSIKLEGGSKLSCQASSIPFRPIVFSEKMKQLDGEEQEAIDFHFAKSKLLCEVGQPQFFPFSRQMTVGSGFSNLCFRPKWDGKVFFLNSEKHWTGPETYCIDSVIDFRDNASSSYGTSESELGIVMCSLPPTSSEGPSRKLYGGLMISSSVFLLLTFIVYLLLWDQHGLHGWTTLGHSSSMFFMYIFLGTAHILQVQQTKGIAVLKTMECVAVGVLAHFFFLSTFCWLTLISFDLWYTFRSFNPNPSKSKNAKRFCFYVFFGWGVPTIFVVISRILDNKLSDDACSTIVLAQYGQLSCYVNPKALGEYIYYPIAILLLLNLIFFGVTTWKLYQYRKSTRVATENLDDKRQFFKLFVKLFCVMGVTWILEVVSFLHVGTEIPWYWNVVDSLNVCQAIAVFIIYVCKKETVFALRKSYPKLKVILDPLIKLFRCKAPASDTKSSTMRRRYGDGTRTSMLSSRSTQRSTTGSTMETDA